MCAGPVINGANGGAAGRGSGRAGSAQAHAAAREVLDLLLLRVDAWRRRGEPLLRASRRSAQVLEKAQGLVRTPSWRVTHAGSTGDFARTTSDTLGCVPPHVLRAGAARPRRLLLDMLRGAQAARQCMRREELPLHDLRRRDGCAALGGDALTIVGCRVESPPSGSLYAPFPSHIRQIAAICSGSDHSVDFIQATHGYTGASRRHTCARASPPSRPCDLANCGSP